MSETFLITHYYHSGFSIACGDTLLVFDYWRGEEGELSGRLELSADRLRSFAHVVVFISHEHPDHLDPIVFTWRDLTDVTYVISHDMPESTTGRRMAPGDRAFLREDLSVAAFGSTDLGVSFLVSFRGCRFFHAGDLNFWHWREESTMQEIDEAEQEFQQEVKPLVKEPIDVAFFPVDPRQGTMFEAGANYFILTVKPRLLIPMHYFHRKDVAVEYSRTAGNRSTQVLAMPRIGETICLMTDDDGYLNISAREEAEEPAAEVPAETPEEPAFSDTDTLTMNNPFFETDLPVAQLAEENESDNEAPRTE